MPDRLRGRRSRLYTDPLRFNRVTWARKSRSLLLSWVADTEVPNRFYIRFCGLRPPLAPGALAQRLHERGQRVTNG